MKRSLTLESSEGDHLGAGFLLGHNLVLTAAHCLKDHRDSAVNVVVHMSELEILRFSGMAKFDDVLDLAAIEIEKPSFHLKGLIAEFVPSVLEDAKWRFQSLNPRYAGLMGTVQDPKKLREMHTGRVLESLELWVKHRVTSFVGYSGGPVEVPHEGAPLSWGVAGMLLEELREGPGSNMASDILYAATLGVISRSSVLNNAISGGLGLGVEKPESPLQPQDAAQHQDETKIVLRRLKAWAGVDPETSQEHEELTELAESIVSDLRSMGSADAD